MSVAGESSFVPSIPAGYRMIVFPLHGIKIGSASIDLSLGAPNIIVFEDTDMHLPLPPAERLQRGSFRETDKASIFHLSVCGLHQLTRGSCHSARAVEHLLQSDQEPAPYQISHQGSVD
jgi:hypothetical protein